MLNSIKLITLGCAGEEAINDKRKAYIEELESLLANQALQSEEEAYKSYCDYAYVVGFSVRKWKQYYFPGTKKVRAKWYCCSKEGFSYDSDDVNRTANNGQNILSTSSTGSTSCYSNRLDARTGCKAMIHFICNNEGQWKAAKFVKEHNHEMADLHERQFLRSARAVLASNSVGLRPVMSEMSRPAYEVQSSEDVVYLDSDEEESVVCLHCNGREEAIVNEGSSNADVVELEKKLLGQFVHSEEEAYKVYCNYAHIIGFSVRKGKQYYFPGTKRLRSKSYYCSKEGLNNDITVATHNKLEARTGCQAMISFTCDDDGQWKVTKFIKEHNHKMAEPYERHLLRSARPILDTKNTCTCQLMMFDLNKGTRRVGSSGMELLAHRGSVLEPHEGMVFESENTAKVFYDEYARRVGFLIRVSPGSQTTSGAGCQAMITLQSDKSGKCVVTRFLRDHNHPLTIFPKEVGYTMDEKDRKIQQLKAELQNKRRLCALYREQLTAVVKVVEEHAVELSKRIEFVVNNLKGIEG